MAAGGAYNPFSVLYLVYITLAAVVLGSRWTWFLAALSVGCCGLLFLARSEGGLHGGADLKMHLRGIWVAFAVAAGLTAYFVVELSAAIERRDVAMAEMRDRIARHERLVSVTTLVARVEWEHINRVLADCGGNVSRAASVLGIHRRSLQRKLAKYPASR